MWLFTKQQANIFAFKDLIIMHQRINAGISTRYPNSSSSVRKSKEGKTRQLVEALQGKNRNVFFVNAFLYFETLFKENNLFVNNTAPSTNTDISPFSNLYFH